MTGDTLNGKLTIDLPPVEVTILTGVALEVGERFTMGGASGTRSRWRAVGPAEMGTVIEPDATPTRLPLLWRPRPFKAPRRRAMWRGGR